MLDRSYVASILDYDPASGVFRWKVARGRAKAGHVAGCLSNGYRCIRIDGVLYLAHRLAWLLMTGAWPEHEIDHRDRDRANNAWSNLRDATHAENMMNIGARHDNKLGVKGVYRDGNRFRAEIIANGKRYRLGSYATPTAAADAYQRAANDLHGDFARVA